MFNTHDKWSWICFEKKKNNKVVNRFYKYTYNVVMSRFVKIYMVRWLPAINSITYFIYI
jgi:hypothetical protein